MSTLRELLRNLGSVFRWWYVVAPWEQSVRVRLGRRVDVLGPGVHWRIPAVDIVYRQSVRRRFTTLPTMTLTTTDGKAVTVSGDIAYSIRDIGKLYDTLHDAEDTIESTARGALATYIANNPIDKCSPRHLVEHVGGALDMGRYGLGDVDLFITDFAVVRTYRLIQGQPKDWKNGLSLDTTTPIDREGA